MPMDGAAHHLCTLFSGTPIPSSLLQTGKSAAPVKVMPGVCFHFRSENHNFSVWNMKKNIPMRRHGLHWTSLTCTYIAESTTCPFATLQLHWLLNILDVSHSFYKSTMLRASADMGSTVSPQKEGISPLEYEILNFMENSDKPHSFPTRLELLQADRADLADAILKEGGWLVTGWDLEELNKEAKVQSMYASGVDNSSEVSTGVSMERVENGRNVAADKEVKSVHASGVDDSTEASPGVSMERVGNGRNVANADADGCQQNAMICEEVAERKRGWEKVANLFGLANLKKPEHGGRTSVSALDSPASRKDAVHSILVSPTSPVSLPNDASPSLDVLPHAKKQKRRKKRELSKESSAKFNPNQTVNRINEKVDRRNDRIMEVKSKSQVKSSKVHDESISSRIHGLEMELIATLNSLQVGRHALVEDDKSKQIQEKLEDASDALEFRETELMHIRKELRTTRAQLTATEGKLALELIEAKRKIEEKDQRLMESLKVLEQMRTARIVWANPGSEVLLAGSFDGWTSRRKMQKSSAGVFVTALQLYPGSYEIKFIVNGEWRVDPNRPIIHSNGFENNLLTII